MIKTLRGQGYGYTDDDYFFLNIIDASHKLMIAARNPTKFRIAAKKRVLNCLTVPNLRLNDVFTDVFGKSASSITEYILTHPGETFDVAPFIDRRCKTPMEEIQATVDGAIYTEYAVKLRLCLDYIDELEKHNSVVEAQISELTTPYSSILDLISTIPDFD